jgi:hypothetical protein
VALQPERRNVDIKMMDDRAGATRRSGARWRWWVTVTVLVVMAAAPALAPSGAQPLARAPRCKIFPADNHWNLRVDRLPVKSNSDAIVASIGVDEGLHPDFGSGRWEGAPIGIPVNVVGAKQKKLPVRFQYADESDRGPYPIPRNPKIEGGPRSDGDRHVLVVDKSRCKLYELFAAYPRRGGARWVAGSGAIWNLNSNRLRPRGWTSADAAGLPILPGLARYEDVRRGRIDHALRFTVSQTRRAYIYPARHHASDLTDRDLPAMGERLRLKANFDISGYPRQARIVLRALKQYGMIVADNGSDWYITGSPSRYWNNDALRTLRSVTGDNFEVVDTTDLPRP